MNEHPDYAFLPESIKMLYSEQEYAWLGDDRYKIIEREALPDFDVVE